MLNSLFYFHSKLKFFLILFIVYCVSLTSLLAAEKPFEIQDTLHDSVLSHTYKRYNLPSKLFSKTDQKLFFDSSHAQLIHKENLDKYYPNDLTHGFHWISREGESAPSEFILQNAINTLPGSSYPTLRPEPQRDTELFILSGDGGGTRGLIEALAIAKLERLMNMPVSRFYDIIAGTSIFGIGGLLLAVTKDGKNPIMSGSELTDLLKHQSRLIFPQPRNFLSKAWDELTSLWYTQYSPDVLTFMLQDYFQETTLTNTLTRVLTTAVNAATNTPRIFDSNNLQDRNYKNWQIGRSTSAAPTFLPAFMLNGQYYVDGGVCPSLNNPAFEAVMAAKNTAGFSLNTTNLLSLGTGDMPVVSIPNNAGKLAVASVIDAMMTTGVKGVDMTVKQLLPSENYTRLNPTLSQNVGLDHTDDETMKILQEAGESQYEKLEEYVATDKVRRRLEKIASSL